jgi:hypothetical protein
MTMQGNWSNFAILMLKNTSFFIRFPSLPQITPKNKIKNAQSLSHKTTSSKGVLFAISM